MLYILAKHVLRFLPSLHITHCLRWTEEVHSKKTLDLYAAVKKQLEEEKYVNDPGDRRGARLKFRLEPDQQV